MDAYLFRDHTQISPWVGRTDYNLITDMADEAINYMRGLSATAPDQPFFVYYVPGGSHSPHQPKKEWSDRSKASSTWAGMPCATRSSPIRSASA